MILVSKKYNLRFNLGFTLIELMVVISVIGMLSSVILSSLQNSRDKARVASSIMFSSSMYRSWGADAIGFWGFDESSGHTKDKSVNGLNMSCIGVCTRSATSPFPSGYSVDFRGISSTATVNNNFTAGASYNLSGGYTTSIWLYAEDNTVAGVPFNLYNASYRVAFMNIVSGGEQFYVGPSYPGNLQGSLVTYTLPIGKWFHVAISYDGSNVVRIYIDGKLVDSKTIGSASGLIFSNIYVGNLTTSSPNHFMRGMIDDFALYPYALTVDRIEQIYAKGKIDHELAYSSTN